MLVKRVPNTEAHDRSPTSDGSWTSDDLTSDDFVELLKQGRIAVIPTDTLYGMVGSALLPKTVEQIYKLRDRNRSKPMIVLIADPTDLSLFGISLTPSYQILTTRYWPGCVTIIFPCASEQFQYLHRGTGTIAFRVPDNRAVRNLLKKTGPLVAPSVNREGTPPAETIEEARAYFGDRVHAYIDAGRLTSMPSTILRVDELGNIAIVRQGAQQHIDPEPELTHTVATTTECFPS